MPAATARERPTLDEVRLWPAAVNVEEAAAALGVSRASLYQAVKDGTAPVRSIRVGARIKVLTWSLVALLEGKAA